MLVRRYGYGVPDLERMLRSASNDVTLVVEGEMQPFRLDGTQAKSRDMTLHDFPWPRAELEALGGSMVVMRVSLEISWSVPVFERAASIACCCLRVGVRHRATAGNRRDRGHTEAFHQKERPAPDLQGVRRARQGGRNHISVPIPEFESVAPRDPRGAERRRAVERRHRLRVLRPAR